MKKKNICEAKCIAPQKNQETYTMVNQWIAIATLVVVVAFTLGITLCVLWGTGTPQKQEDNKE